MPPTVESSFDHLSDREILEAILESQLKVEAIVNQTVESAGPMLSALSGGGLLGMLRR